MPRKDGLAKSTVAQGVPLALGYLLNLVSAPIAIRELGIEHFGIWSLTGAVAQYGALFDLGISRSVTRFIALHDGRGDYEAQRRTVGVAASVLSAIGVALIAVSFFFGRNFHGVFHAVDALQGQTLLMCSSVILICALLSRAFASICFGRGRMVVMNLVLALGNSAMIGGGIIALLLTPSLENLAIGSAAGALLGLLLAIAGVCIIEHELPVGVPRKDDYTSMVSFGIKGQAVLVADLFVFQFSKVAIGVLVGPAAAGIYELGSRLALGGRAFGSMVSSVLLPRLTNAFSRHGPGEARAMLISFSRQTVATSVAPIGLVISVSLPFSLLWLPSDGHSVAIVSVILSFSFLVNVSTGPATVLAAAVGKPGLVAISALSTAGFNVLLTLLLVPAFQINGALIATTTSVVAGAVFGLLLIERDSNSRLILYIMGNGGPLVWCVVLSSVAVVIGAFTAVNASDTTRLVVLLGCGAGFTAVYVATCAVFNYIPAIRFKLGKIRGTHDRGT